MEQWFARNLRWKTQPCQTIISHTWVWTFTPKAAEQIISNDSFPKTLEKKHFICHIHVTYSITASLLQSNAFTSEVVPSIMLQLLLHGNKQQIPPIYHNDLFPVVANALLCHVGRKYIEFLSVHFQFYLRSQQYCLVWANAHHFYCSNTTMGSSFCNVET